jgi:hypothetical protein
MFAVRISILVSLDVEKLPEEIGRVGQKGMYYSNEDN